MAKRNKKILIIMNPMAGTKQANKYLADIVSVFCKGDYDVSVRTTTKVGDGKDYVIKNGADFDIIVPIGGDGTFNEVVAGIQQLGLKKDVGYIPAGSTNDFGSSLGLSKDYVKAAKDIVKGEVVKIDCGEFNGRTFSYVAAFGAFTQASCTTNQKAKNDFGFIAYLLSGLKDIKNFRKHHLLINADGKKIEGDYIFGAVTNATTVAGFFKLKKKDVDLSDGKFEVILIKAPKDPAKFGKIIVAALASNFEKYPDVTEFFKAKKIEIEASKNMPWTLDGEYQKGAKNITISNKKRMVNIILPKKQKKTVSIKGDS